MVTSRTFLVELQNRPDGITNQNITSYSTFNATMSAFYQRCAAAVSNTTFLNVTLIVFDADGIVYENRNIETSYELPEVTE